MTEPAARPALSGDTTGAELQRWYWLKEELVAFARSRGISTAGGKAELTARIVAVLDGHPVPAPPGRRADRGPQLRGPLSASDVIPPGQRCSQAVRAWFVEHAGPGFRFDEPLRTFFADADGTRTLGDALAHWHATRERGPSEIGRQFELNRFAREWHRNHPGGTRADALAAWRRYRALPVEARDDAAPGTGPSGRAR